MANVNKVIIMGRLGRDPEIKQAPSGNKVCNFSVATSEFWNDKSGQRQEKTEWHNVVVWGNQAESCAKYLKKGSSVYLEGTITTKSWDAEDGNKRYKTEITAKSVQFVSFNGNGHGNEKSGLNSESGANQW